MRPSSPAPSSEPRAEGEPALPRRVLADLDAPLAGYWRDRLAQHTGDWYMGLRMQKMPEDLRVYEHLLWATTPDAVVELGSHRGGSTLWFRDRLVTLARYRPGLRPRVVSVGLDTGHARDGVGLRDPDYAGTIDFVDGDVLDPDLPARVARLLPAGARCLVVEDSAHTYATTMAALHGFSRFVATGGFFVVEDGVVDTPALRAPGMGAGGVLDAVRHWLGSGPGAAFVLRRDLELYGVTSSPAGWLQRVRARPDPAPVGRAAACAECAEMT